MIALILLPIVFAVLQIIRKGYIFSPLVTLSCAAIAAPFAPVMAIALIASAVGDWFLAHKGNDLVMYLMGIIGFFLAHVVFIVHAILQALGSAHAILFLGQNIRIPPVRAGLITGIILLAGYLPYLLLRVIRKVPKLLQIPVVLYTLISVAGLACAAATGDAIYALGIASILFSDTMIAECDFVGNKPAGKLIMPTYYLCHILVALSALIH